MEALPHHQREFIWLAGREIVLAAWAGRPRGDADAAGKTVKPRATYWCSWERARRRSSSRPVVAALRGADDFRCTVVATGQHKEMFRQVADTFGFVVDADLDVMCPNQTLAGLTARLMEGIDGWLGSAQPDMALVQGDTTTVFVASLACFYRRIPIGHVEAGLRTGTSGRPSPRRQTAGWPLR